MILVLALVAVAAAQYVPYAYNGAYRSGYYGSPYAAAPVAYSGLGYRTYGAGAYGAGAYGAYGAYPTAYLG